MPGPRDRRLGFPRKETNHTEYSVWHSNKQQKYGVNGPALARFAGALILNWSVSLCYGRSLIRPTASTPGSPLRLYYYQNLRSVHIPRDSQIIIFRLRPVVDTLAQDPSELVKISVPMSCGNRQL